MGERSVSGRVKHLKGIPDMSEVNPTPFVYATAAGDAVSEDEVVCEIETDKVAERPRVTCTVCHGVS